MLIAVWIDPVTPGHLILGLADSVDSFGRIEESIDIGVDSEVEYLGLNGRGRGLHRIGADNS